MEEIHELALPLLQQRLGRQDEDRAGVFQRHQQGCHRELYGLPEAHLVGEDQASAAEAMTVHREAYEVLLVWPEPLFPAVDRALDGDRSRVRILLPPV